MRSGNIKDLKLHSGIVYRNPVPHIFSKQAYFPSVVVQDNGEILASLVIGEAFEAVNLDTYFLRSTDSGLSWNTPAPLLPPEAKVCSSNCGRLTSLPGGEAVSMVVRSRREDHLNEGLANPDNLGFVPTDLLLVRSFDYGHTWSAPEMVTPPLEGPSFEACSSIVPLRDGRWIWPTSTWRGWDGYSPNGMKMIALISGDRGRSWPEYMNIMDGNAHGIIFWEGKVLELSNGLLLAVSWAYDERQGRDLPNHYSLSSDGGQTWSTPASTSICGQTMAVTELAAGRLLTVYRRTDSPGLWAGIARIQAGTWHNEGEYCLWGGRDGNLNTRSGQMVQDFNELKFGAPWIANLPDGSLYIVFWCYEQLVSNIRWFKLTLE